MGYGLESNMWQEYYTWYVTGQLAERQLAELMFFSFGSNPSQLGLRPVPVRVKTRPG